MMTLEALRCWRRRSIWEVSQALHLDIETTMALFSGTRHHNLTPAIVQQLALCLGVPFNEVVAAADTSYALNVYYRVELPPEEQLFSLWQQEGWIPEQPPYAPDSRNAPGLPPQVLQALALLGLRPGVTPELVQRTFRLRVRAAADGKGGFTEDMDALVSAKEILLDYYEQSVY